MDRETLEKLTTIANYLDDIRAALGKGGRDSSGHSLPGLSRIDQNLRVVTILSVMNFFIFWAVAGVLLAQNLKL